jgi:hypothetical protein
MEMISAFTDVLHVPNLTTDAQVVFNDIFIRARQSKLCLSDQCCGAGAARSRIFLSEPDPEL